MSKVVIDLSKISDSDLISYFHYVTDYLNYLIKVSSNLANLIDRCAESGVSNIGKLKSSSILLSKKMVEVEEFSLVLQREINTRIESISTFEFKTKELEEIIDQMNSFVKEIQLQKFASNLKPVRD